MNKDSKDALNRKNADKLKVKFKYVFQLIKHNTL
jgi:hypothetical protein